MFAVREEMVTRANRKDIEDLRDLSLRKQEGRIGKAGIKKMNRLQIRLHREGVLRKITHDDLRAHAQLRYDAAPWHVKFRLKTMFRWKLFVEWCQRKHAAIVLWWEAR